MAENPLEKHWLMSNPLLRVIRKVAARIYYDTLIRKTQTFGDVTWLGRPVWQNVQDLWTLQEVICRIKPSLIIECGTNRGGSSFFFATLFDLMGTEGKIVTVDVEKLHDMSHPRITYLLGSSTSDEIYNQIKAMADGVTGPILVMLDSDHSQKHVAGELERYAPLATVGSYCFVQDGCIDTEFMYRKARPGPLPAIKEYVAAHPEFQVDHALCERFVVTHHPLGWLKRVA
ncbi:CmcI family methyltransferase [Verrucomicrobium spinosum]|uniref:CmcI family methyltransferase n=1 Tax=Verrucomicrobium spinosum TaxID=2736 RepID=UPI0001745549|nr:CmcI family methyltransferase [Verrucomicrobium spinosum]